MSLRYKNSRLLSRELKGGVNQQTKLRALRYKRRNPYFERRDSYLKIPLSKIMDKNQEISNHTIIGFALSDCSLLLTYEQRVQVVAGAGGFQSSFKLCLWRFSLQTRLVRVASIQLFGGSMIVSRSSASIKLMVLQTYDAPNVVCVHATPSAAADGGNSVAARQNYVSFVVLPSGSSSLVQNLHYSYLVRAPFPSFSPTLSVVSSTSLLLNCGNGLLHVRIGASKTRLLADYCRFEPFAGLIVRMPSNSSIHSVTSFVEGNSTKNAAGDDDDNVDNGGGGGDDDERVVDDVSEQGGIEGDEENEKAFNFQTTSERLTSMTAVGLKRLDNSTSQQLAFVRYQLLSTHGNNHHQLSDGLQSIVLEDSRFFCVESFLLRVKATIPNLSSSLLQNYDHRVVYIDKERELSLTCVMAAFVRKRLKRSAASSIADGRGGGGGGGGIDIYLVSLLLSLDLKTNGVRVAQPLGVKHLQNIISSSSLLQKSAQTVAELRRRFARPLLPIYCILQPDSSSSSCYHPTWPLAISINSSNIQK